MPEEDVVRRYYKSIIKFWDKYRYLVDEWNLFYNGYDYAPIIVSFGSFDELNAINLEMQNKFNTIYEHSKENINVI